MDNVSAFNNELSGLYDTKPPISKAKMAAITRAAMKAIKFYKHVVQSVEKFILKCKPEYKVPGLYVIDSIVRQSRHQFGPEKDVFAPRFARNMKQTFANLFRCAPEDKSRIIRVLNLWQKNSVFAPEVIQPLFDLADPNHPIYQQNPATNAQDISGISNGLNTSGQENATASASEEGLGISSDMAIGHQAGNTLDSSTIRHLQQLQQILIRQTNESTTGSGANQSDSVKFNKKLLDYDYGDEDEEDKSTSPHVSNVLDGNNLTQLLNDPNVLRQLQTLQKLKQQEEKQNKLNEMRIQEEAFEKHLQNVLKGTSGPPPSTQPPPQGLDTTEKEVEYVGEIDKIEVINLDGNDSRSTSPDRDRYKRRRTSRSRSRDRGRDRDRRRRSRSRSRSRSPKTNRRRTSRERDRNKEKEREKEKEKEREYERERRRKGLPDIKKEHLSVCSTTLWVGHLSKLVQQEELSDTFGKYGDIVSIDMIHPRGCAFIVMNRRQDAYKAMSSLKNHKMQGRAITISWAAGKGVKSKEWKDYWDLDLGVSYIPWNKLSPDTDMEALEEGGMCDEESLPIWMKERINQKNDIRDLGGNPGLYGPDGMPNLDTTQPPPSAGGMIPGVPMVPPFPMGPVPRLIPPLGVPMPGSMVPGMPLPPNMVPGMPPPHMMLPPGGMVPGFPIPQMDKSIPPPSTGSSDTSTAIPSPFMSNLHMQTLAAAHQQPPGFGNLGLPPQFQQPPGGTTGASSGASQNDDHMDIEMDDESPAPVNKLVPPINFSQPPPMFSGFSETMQNQGHHQPHNQGNSIQSLADNRRNDREMHRNDDRRGEVDFRERGRDSRDREMHGDFNNRSERNRWGNDRNRSNDRDRDQNPRMGADKMNENRPDFSRPPGLAQEPNRPELPQIWRDNVPNFQQPPNFSDNNRRGGLNIAAVDMQNPPPNRGHDFFELRREAEFNPEERRGVQRDFFPNITALGGNLNNLGNLPSLANIGNRFGPPPPGAGRGSPMPPMRGAPPPPFGPRLGSMFMRGPPRPGPPAAPFAFNERPPFEREERGRMRGNMQEMRGGRGWRDDEEGGRRGGGRFQNRDRFNDREDRKNRDRNDRDRERNDRDRNDRGRGDRDRRNDKNSVERPERDRGERMQSRNRRSTSWQEEEQQQPAESGPTQQAPQDTEEDWDQELSEHNISQDFANQEQDDKDANTTEMNESSDQRFQGFEPQQSSSDVITNEMNNDNACSLNEDEFKQKAEAGQDITHDDFAIPNLSSITGNHNEQKEQTSNVETTPLYDERYLGYEKSNNEEAIEDAAAPECAEGLEN